MRVRAALPEDAPRLVEMIHSLAAFHGDEAETTEEHVRREVFGPRPLLTAFVAEADGRLIGCTVLEIDARLMRGGRRVVMDLLFVEPDHRGAGVGRALLEAAFQFGRDEGYAVFSVSADTHNAHAIDFYHRAGLDVVEPGSVRFRTMLTPRAPTDRRG